MRLNLTSPYLALLCAAAMLSYGSTSAQTPQTPNLQGTYTLDDAASDDVTKAIDAAVKPVPFYVRKQVKERLTKYNRPYQRVEIGSSGTEVSITTDQWAEIRTPSDGKPFAWTRPTDAEKFSVSTVWECAKLKQTFTGKEGRRINTYNLEADGKTLTMQVEVTSTRLKKLLLKYQLVYKRTTRARPEAHTHRVCHKNFLTTSEIESTLLSSPLLIAAKIFLRHHHSSRLLPDTSLKR